MTQPPEITSDHISQSDAARARAVFYRAVADVLLYGPTPAVRSILASAVSADVLPAGQDAVDDADLANHYSLFGRSVLPYSSSFLEADGCLGGTVSTNLVEYFSSVGWRERSTDSVPDHFATQLQFLAFLSQVEIEAIGNAEARSAELAAKTANHLIGTFLAPAFPPFLHAVQRHGDPFYASVIETVWTVMVDQFASNDFVETDLAFHELPDTVIDLEDQRTGVRQIVEHLCSCKRSGIYISQSDLATLASTDSIPRGFGTRVMTFANLVRSAAALDSLEGLITRLKGLMNAERNQYRADLFQHNNLLSRIADSYKGRLDRTSELLDAMVLAQRSSSESAS